MTSRYLSSECITSAAKTFVNMDEAGDSASFTLSETPSKKRKPKFSGAELELFLQLIEEKKNVIYGSFNHGTTSKDKKDVWQVIAEKMIATGFVRRTAEELRRKKENWFSEVKKKAADISKRQRASGAAGAADQPVLSALEQRILGVMGTTVAQGIDGGVVSSESTPIYNPDILNDDGNPVKVNEDEMECEIEKPITSSCSQPQKKTVKRKRDTNGLILGYLENISCQMERQSNILQKILHVQQERLLVEKIVAKVEIETIPIES